MKECGNSSGKGNLKGALEKYQQWMQFLLLLAMWVNCSIHQNIFGGEKKVSIPALAKSGLLSTSLTRYVKLCSWKYTYCHVARTSAAVLKKVFKTCVVIHFMSSEILASIKMWISGRQTSREIWIPIIVPIIWHSYYFIFIRSHFLYLTFHF